MERPAVPPATNLGDTQEHRQIHAALRDCYDPNLPCNIVDLGFLRDLTVTPDSEAPGANIPGVPPRVRVALTLTPAQQDDTVEAHLRGQILNRLAGLAIVSRTDLNFRYDPPWSPVHITPLGRRILGLDGNRNLVQLR